MADVRYVRILVCLLSVAMGIDNESALAESLRTQFVLATYRLENSKTSATGFVISRPRPGTKQKADVVLVTAAHVFQTMSGDEATIVLREHANDGPWVARPATLRIRDKDKPLWLQHPTQDVAVLPLPVELNVTSIPVSLLATQHDWDTNPPEPGSTIRAVGYPHASVFKPSPAGFPLVRIGCIASYPVAPGPSNPTFLVDYNTFEGDSGGPLYYEPSTPGESLLKIAGLVQGQHFLDERYQLVYASGLVKKQLGLAIVVSSLSIIETLTQLEPEQ
jgi:hypothetical protein